MYMFGKVGTVGDGRQLRILAEQEHEEEEEEEERIPDDEELDAQLLAHAVNASNAATDQNQILADILLNIDKNIHFPNAVTVEQAFSQLEARSPLPGLLAGGGGSRQSAEPLQRRS